MTTTTNQNEVSEERKMEIAVEFETQISLCALEKNAIKRLFAEFDNPLTDEDMRYVDDLVSLIKKHKTTRHVDVWKHVFEMLKYWNTKDNESWKLFIGIFGQVGHDGIVKKPNLNTANPEQVPNIDESIKIVECAHNGEFEKFGAYGMMNIFFVITMTAVYGTYTGQFTFDKAYTPDELNVMMSGQRNVAYSTYANALNQSAQALTYKASKESGTLVDMTQSA